MLNVTSDGGVVTVTATGTVTHDDYKDVLIPEVERQIKAQVPVRLLYVLGPEFDGYSAGAM